MGEKSRTNYSIPFCMRAERCEHADTKECALCILFSRFKMKEKKDD